ncbi:tachylectin-related carbohydrate-binding protein [Streptomyces sp. NBC_00377]|uniref:tachylectin-related carbohydrate-binding protein n=1 Tax=unclassified Streptomyces TaxID=2593676 RepID=UPI002E1C277A|nr:MULTISPECIES: tachylectin-related carbohydrate-binding protein [unclassified Streptomyces]
MTAAAAAALPLLVAAPGTARAADSATCPANGRTYVTNAAGELLQYTMADPLAGSPFSSYQKVTAGWGSYGKVLAGPAGQFYAFKSDGTYYAHRTESGTWDVAPKRVSTALGWLSNAADREQATVDRSGWLWVADNLGQLYAYRYDASIEGLRSLKVLDRGWDRYNLITAGDSGVLYGRATDGRLYRSRYDFASQRWIERHVLVGSAGWGNFKTITAGGGDTVVAVQTSGAAMYYRYDENTGTWPVLAKQVAAGGWQNFPNVTSEPDNCNLVVNHTPAAAPVPLESYTPNSVMQASDGKLELAYTDNIGRLVHGRTDPADINGAQWTVISEQEAFTGRPSLAEHTDGRVVVTAHTTSAGVWQRDQAAKSSADWAAWKDLAGAMRQHARTAKTPSGLLVQFAADADGAPWYRLENVPNNTFMGWIPLSGTGFTGPLTAVTVRDGIQLFGRKADGTLSTALFKEDGTLSAWAAIGTQAITGTPSVIIYPGYRMRVFATDTSGNVVTTAQSAEGGAYGTWQTAAGVTAQGSPSAVISPLTGLTEVVVRGTDGYIHNTGETTQGSGAWRTWQQVSFETSATEPTAFTYTNPTGPTWAYTFRTSDNQTRIYQVQQTSSLSAMRAEADAPDFQDNKLPTPPAK